MLIYSKLYFLSNALYKCVPMEKSAKENKK